LKHHLSVTGSDVSVGVPTFVTLISVQQKDFCTALAEHD